MDNFSHTHDAHKAWAEARAKRGALPYPLVWLEGRDAAVVTSTHTNTDNTLRAEDRIPILVADETSTAALRARLQLTPGLPRTFAGLGSSSRHLRSLVALCVSPKCPGHSGQTPRACAAVAISWRHPDATAIIHLVRPTPGAAPRCSLVSGLGTEKSAAKKLRKNAHQVFQDTLAEVGPRSLVHEDNLWFVFDLTRGTSPERSSGALHVQLQ